jgi:predicted DNA-binding protein with PD1-like motif
MNICFRLKPGDDLKQKIEDLAIRKKISGIIASGVGSLNKLKIRLADSKTILEKEEAYEIVSLNGTLSPDGVHLHISVADAKGAVTGGHLKDGCIINTTCEVAIISFDDIKFSRVYDKSTDYEELNVESAL